MGNEDYEELNGNLKDVAIISASSIYDRLSSEW